jgi:hypothetical protein
VNQVLHSVVDDTTQPVLLAFSLSFLRDHIWVFLVGLPIEEFESLN